MRIVRFLLPGVAAMVLAAGCGRPVEPEPRPLPRPDAPRPAGAGAKAAEPEDPQVRGQEAALRADLGQVYLKYGKFAEAHEAYGRAIVLTQGLSENAVYHIGLAEAAKGLGKDQEAVQNLETAAEIFKKILPTVGEDKKDFYYEKICLIYRDLGRREEAVSWAEKIAGGQGSPEAAVKLARLYAFLGEGALAIDTYGMALKKLGGAPEALSVKLEFADFLARVKNLEAARSQAEEVAAKAADPKLRAAAKRMLLQIYDALGILDQVELDAPPSGEGGESENGGKKDE